MIFSDKIFEKKIINLNCGLAKRWKQAKKDQTISSIYTHTQDIDWLIETFTFFKYSAPFYFNEINFRILKRQKKQTDRQKSTKNKTKILEYTQKKC